METPGQPRDASEVAEWYYNQLQPNLAMMIRLASSFYRYNQVSRLSYSPIASHKIIEYGQDSLYLSNHIILYETSHQKLTWL